MKKLLLDSPPLEGCPKGGVVIALIVMESPQRRNVVFVGKKQRPTEAVF
jgi:hypothetical protein